MTTVREQVLRSHLGALETATGQHAGEEQIHAALELSTGSKVVVARPEYGLLIASLAAVASDELSIHLVTATTEDAAAMSEVMAQAGLTHITCAIAEKFVFPYLNGQSNDQEFAIVADANQTLLEDMQTPYIVMNIAKTTEVIFDGHEADHLVKGRNYIVENGAIIVRDADNGTLYPGRRLAQPLHAALQAREGLAVDPEGEVIAQITSKDCFCKYKRLAAVATQSDDRYQSEYGLAQAA